MASHDVNLRDHVWKILVAITLGCVTFVLLRRYFNTLSHRSFLLNGKSRWQKRYRELINVIKKDIYKSLHELDSSDFELMNRGLIRILEITENGDNNKLFFPRNCRYRLIDVNTLAPHWKSTDNNCNVVRGPFISPLKYSSSLLEELTTIGDETFDAVVTNFIFCSLTNPAAVIGEIQRILALGGKIYFLEHSRDHSRSQLSKIQSAFTRSKVWPNLFNNCHLDRDFALF